LVGIGPRIFLSGAEPPRNITRPPPTVGRSRRGPQRGSPVAPHNLPPFQPHPPKLLPAALVRTPHARAAPPNPERFPAAETSWAVEPPIFPAAVSAHELPFKTGAIPSFSPLSPTLPRGVGAGDTPWVPCPRFRNAVGLRKPWFFWGAFFFMRSAVVPGGLRNGPLFLIHFRKR